jgi:chromosome segregation ATPase
VARLNKRLVEAERELSGARQQLSEAQKQGTQSSQALAEAQGAMARLEGEKRDVEQKLAQTCASAERHASMVQSLQQEHQSALRDSRKREAEWARSREGLSSAARGCAAIEAGWRSLARSQDQAGAAEACDAIEHTWAGPEHRAMSALPSPLGERLLDMRAAAGGESFLRVHWVAVPEALRARRANRRGAAGGLAA